MADGIKARLRAELEGEVGAGFPKLRRIPSHGMIKFLDYFERLGTPERAALLDARVEAGALSFAPPQLRMTAYEELIAGTPALAHFAAAMNEPAFIHGFRYEGLRMTKAVRNDAESMMYLQRTRSTLDFEPRDDLPKDLVPDGSIGSVTTAKAPLLRKLLNQVLPQLLGARAAKRPGGELVYDCAIGETPMKVSIIFSNLYAQLSYGATMKIPERNVFAFRLTYEGLWGPDTGWDYLTEENAARSIELLSELLTMLVGLARA